jgi:NADH:ubiquinone oxidoreductase subunit 5 (subunit L)/multisubunit Na+/H+ antiporter MnhA subunit
VLLGFLAYSRSTISHKRLAEQFSPVYRLLVNKYYLDDVIQWAIDRLVLVFSRFVAYFDRRFVNDIGVNGPAFGVQKSGIWMRLVQTGQMYNYGMAMATGVVVLVLIWWFVLRV